MSTKDGLPLIIPVILQGLVDLIFQRLKHLRLIIVPFQIRFGWQNASQPVAQADMGAQCSINVSIPENQWLSLYQRRLPILKGKDVAEGIGAELEQPVELLS